MSELAGIRVRRSACPLLSLPLFIQPLDVSQKSLHVMVVFTIASVPLAAGCEERFPIQASFETLVDATLKFGFRFVPVFEVHPPSGISIATRIQMAA